MKLKNKDIKDMLKEEMDKVTPDVYAKVKGTPINRLKLGETPEQAFRKRLVTLLLLLTLAVFIVLTVSLIAYSVNPDDEFGVLPSKSYISIVVTKGDNVQKFGIIADTDGTLLCVVNETTSSKINLSGMDRGILPRIINAEAGDSIHVSALNDSNNVACGSCEKQLKTAESMYSGKAYSITYDVNESADKDGMIAFIKANGGGSLLNKNSSVRAMADQYLSVAEKLS